MKAAGGSAISRIKSELGVKLRYPTYREGLASLLRLNFRHQSGDGGFEAAQVLRARLAMVAVLDERQLDILAAEQIDEIERVAPGHVGIAHALQNPHRQVEMQRAASPSRWLRPSSIRCLVIG